MTDLQTIDAEIRADVGKGASRRLRREGKVPAILYGGHDETVSLALDHEKTLHAADQEAFYSSVIDLRVADREPHKVVVRDLQRHPYRQQIMHVDFVRVSADEKLRLSVPLHFTGEEKSSAGRSVGVVIQHLVTELEIQALPGDLPEYIEVDLSAIDAGDVVTLSAVPLPEGVEVVAQLADEDFDPNLASAQHIRASQGEGVVAAEADEALGTDEAADVPVVDEEETEGEGDDADETPEEDDES